MTGSFMFTLAFRMPILILIGWTILFFIFPLAAMLIVCLGVSAIFFYFALVSLRQGSVRGGGYGFPSFSFDRSRQPIQFWIVNMLILGFGIDLLSLVIFGFFHNRHGLLIRYF